MEIEAKFRVDTHDAVRGRLREAGADALGMVVETNVILDRKDGSLRAAGCGLRIRSTVGEDGAAGVTTLTYKGPQRPGPLKAREEREVHVDDAASLEHILASCGFDTILWYQKRRETWRCDDCLVELDEPPHLGRFVEIEGPGERSIRRVQQRLGLYGLEHERRSYVHLLLEYCRAHGISDGRLRLPE